MIIETKNLMTLNNFAKLKNIARQRAYKIVSSNKVDCIKINGVKFIIMNWEANEYQRSK